METDIRKCVEALEKLEKEFNYGAIETAIYIYARLGTDEANALSSEKIKKLYNKMQDIDGSIFDEELNEWTDENIEN